MTHPRNTTTRGEKLPEYSGYIYKKKFLHPALRFEDRPFLAQEKATINGQIQNLYAQDKNAEGERLAADAIARRLVSWNLTSKGESVPTTLEHALRVEPVLLARVFSIMMGVSQSDPDPEWTNDEADAHTAASLESALAGETNLTDQEWAAKNSEKV